MLFSSEEKEQPFLMYLNSRHENINFSIEEVYEGSLSFLDVTVSRENMNFVTNIYRKQYSLFYRCFRICSDWKKFHYEINKLKYILSKNNYPSNVIDFCIKIFLNKLHHCKKSMITVPKKDLFLVLPFMKLEHVYVVYLARNYLCIS